MKHLIILAASALAAPALAQPSAPPSPTASPTAPTASQSVDPAAFEAARELLRSINFNQQMDQTAQQMTQSSFKTVMDAQERAAGMTFPEELKRNVYELVRRNNEQLIAEMKPTALDDAARIYAKYFTAEEIRELQRLQSNPVMAKAQKLAPQLTTDLIQIGMARATARLPELSRQINVAVHDWFARHKQAAPHRS